MVAKLPIPAVWVVLVGVWMYVYTCVHVYRRLGLTPDTFITDKLFH